MSKTIAPSSSRSHGDYDLRTELGLLRGEVSEALMEARQSSNFCRKIQRDIDKFVRSQQLTRECEDVVGNEELTPQLLASLDGHLSEFEGFIIARVREWLEGKIATEFTQRLNSCKLQLDQLYQEQREQEGRLQLLATDAALKKSELRREMKGYASKLWAHVTLLEEKLRSVAPASCTNPDGTAVKEVGLPGALHELVAILTLLSEGLEIERKLNWDERQRWMLFIGRAVEKFRQLGESDEMLAMNFQGLRRVVAEHQQCCREVLACVMGVGQRLGPLSSASTASVATTPAWEGPLGVHSEAEINYQKQFGDFVKELHKIGAALRTLQMEHAYFKNILEDNMVNVAELRQDVEELVSGAAKIGARLEHTNHMRQPHVSPRI
ncbi:hypothetical protein TraAM80_00915 [Trypanosoma rangeli]|uniref:Uncharacterized protein n=1 Tax=Trypanosoma rangeli TaxID=5698 RepID=A0A422P193_TRYRA|nr:uncharacterized protein TraAM80_00915 [Trypanosoma rangeli]RNF11469.1 hypothetical protein TraAM80_00915 [Trypanosoma rangeli]|eukprot:RNF11469.1 hypothetical protein TraAM80_00915 [Trypanosoma rangeli]